MNVPSSIYGVSSSGHIKKWDNQGSIPGHSYMWAFAGVLAPGQQYNCWAYTTTNPSMGVSAKKSRPRFGSGLIDDSLRGSSPRPVYNSWTYAATKP